MFTWLIFMASLINSSTLIVGVTSMFSIEADITQSRVKDINYYSRIYYFNQNSSLKVLDLEAGSSSDCFSFFSFSFLDLIRSFRSSLLEPPPPAVNSILIFRPLILLLSFDKAA